MANSSDWPGAFAPSPVPDTLPEDPAPGWLALLGGEAGGAAGFREAALFGAPEEPAPPPEPPEPDPDAPEPDPHAEALARAYADGLVAGRAAAEATSEALGRRHRALRLTFRALDEAALAVLAADLAATVETLCASVLGEAARDPAGLRTRCEAAARRIGGAADSLVLHLHPDDIALVEEGALGPIRLAPDAALEPGSVVIAGPEGSVADGPAEWRRAIAAAVRG
ncbi:MAG: flagellar biosynthesis protein [Erythrobacter sp.]|uniref:FliH/SctL family protein n=1 Tax=Erythrobacter sp. TaxID=1042 RepID=UPI0025E4B23F|nr:flagellar biosynthesis protein [Erythrobacter sp.]MCM0000922.1 flagellar biosynthesis protein [Erythrobacter sp.]